MDRNILMFFVAALISSVAGAGPNLKFNIDDFVKIAADSVQAPLAQARTQGQVYFQEFYSVKHSKGVSGEAAYEDLSRVIYLYPIEALEGSSFRLGYLLSRKGVDQIALLNTSAQPWSVVDATVIAARLKPATDESLVNQLVKSLNGEFPDLKIEWQSGDKMMAFKNMLSLERAIQIQMRLQKSEMFRLVNFDTVSYRADNVPKIGPAKILGRGPVVDLQSLYDPAFGPAVVAPSRARWPLGHLSCHLALEGLLGPPRP